MENQVGNSKVGERKRKSAVSASQKITGFFQEKKRCALGEVQNKNSTGGKSVAEESRKGSYDELKTPGVRRAIFSRVQGTSSALKLDGKQKKQLAHVDPREIDFTPTGRKQNSNITASRSKRSLNLHRPGSPLGFFGRLPRELIHGLLDYYSLEELVGMASASRAMCGMVTVYVLSHSGIRRFRRNCPIPSVCMECGQHNDFSGSHPITKDLHSAWSNWGSLLKVLTCLLETPVRIEFAQSFFIVHRKRDGGNGVLDNPSAILAWGTLFGQIQRRWEYSELEKVFKAVMGYDQGVVTTMRQSVLEAQCGEETDLERMIRNFFRGFLLDPETPDEGAKLFWQSRILKDLDTKQRGKFLFLLFAPDTSDKNRKVVNWNFAAKQTVKTSDEAVRFIMPYSNALTKLWKTREMTDFPGKWTDLELFSLVEELTTFPEAWAFDNFAALLLLTEPICILALVQRLRKGKVNECAIILNVIKTLAFRWKMTGRLDNILRHLKPYFKIHEDVDTFYKFCITAHQGRISELLSGNLNQLTLTREIMEEDSSSCYLLKRIVLWHSVIPREERRIPNKKTCTTIRVIRKD